jgi:hypothetical protein
MDAKLPASGDRAGTDEEEADGPQAQPDAYGPLKLLRLRKADGRALIVYSRQVESE